MKPVRTLSGCNSALSVLWEQEYLRAWGECSWVEEFKKSDSDWLEVDFRQEDEGIGV